MNLFERVFHDPVSTTEFAERIIELASQHYQLPRRVYQTLQEGIATRDPVRIAIVMLFGFVQLDEVMQMFQSTVCDEDKSWIPGYRNKVAEHFHHLLLSAYVKENVKELGSSFCYACHLSYMRHEIADELIYVSDQEEEGTN